MTEALNRKLHTARLRLGANLLLEQVALFAAIAGAALLLAVLAQRTFAFEVPARWIIAIPAAGGAAILAAAVVWALKYPRRLSTAILIDDRLALRERFSTALAFAGSDDPFARAACQEAHSTAGSARIRGHFPIRPTRRWIVAGACWVAFGAALLMPVLDVLGYESAREKDRQDKNTLAQAKTDLKEALARVEAVVAELGDPKLAEELAKLTELQESGKVAGLKQEAIKRLSDLADQIKKAKGADKMRAANELKDMMKRLRGSGKGLDSRLNQALAQGKFGEAAKLLEDLKQKLQDGELSDEDAKKLAEQLADIGKQLQELAKRQKGLEDALEKAGLSKDMAKLSEDDLRKALKEAGLSDEQIDKLMEAARACRNASGACNGLGQKMAGAGLSGLEGMLTPEELAELIAELSGLEGLQRRLALLEATLEECELAGACLGEGEAGEACEKAGLLLGGKGGKMGPGTWLPRPGMGPGRASGDRPTGPDEKVNMTKTGVKNDPKAGKPIASWYFKGPQVKGEAKQDFKKVAQAAKDRASAAITDNRIPREYQKAVKEYFGDLEKKGE